MVELIYHASEWSFIVLQSPVIKGNIVPWLDGLNGEKGSVKQGMH